MTKTLTLNVIVLLTCSNTTHADESFQWEANLVHTTNENRFFKTDNSLAQATYFFGDVSTKDKPLSEAAFLSRTSNVSVTVDRDDSDFEPTATSIVAGPNVNVGNLPPLTIDVNAVDLPPPISIGGVFTTIPSATVAQPVLPFKNNSGTTRIGGSVRYVSPEGWIGKLSYFTASNDEVIEFEFNSSLELNSDNQIFSTGFGRYLGERTSIEFDYQSNTQQAGSIFSSFPTAFASGTIPENVRTIAGNETNINEFSATVKTMFDWKSFVHTVELALGYEEIQLESSFAIDDPNGNVFSIPAENFQDDSYSRSIGLNYTFYPRKDLSFGVRYLNQTSEMSDVVSSGLFLEWFITPRIAATGLYLSNETDVSSVDTETYAIGFRGRF